MKKLILYIVIAAAVVAMMLSALSAAGYAAGGVDARELKERQAEAHEAAELLRELGISDDSDAIRALREEWWRCEAQLHPCYTEAEVVMLAKTMWGESRGIKSQTEVACIGWTVCNRVDDPAYPDTISGVLTQSGQMYYRESFPVREDLLWLARDVLERWTMERLGYEECGRVLPAGYLWYSGDGAHNWFRDTYRGGARWDYSLPSPYES